MAQQLFLRPSLEALSLNPFRSATEVFPSRGQRPAVPGADDPNLYCKPQSAANARSRRSDFRNSGGLCKIRVLLDIPRALASVASSALPSGRRRSCQNDNVIGVSQEEGSDRKNYRRSGVGLFARKRQCDTAPVAGQPVRTASRGLAAGAALVSSLLASTVSMAGTASAVSEFPVGPFGQGEIGWVGSLALAERSTSLQGEGGNNGGNFGQGGGGGGDGDRGGGDFNQERGGEGGKLAEKEDEEDIKDGSEVGVQASDTEQWIGSLAQERELLFASLSAGKAVAGRRGEGGGMFDWLAGLLHSLLASRLNERVVDRQALMVETADLVIEMLDKRSSEDAFAHRSEVSALRRLQREAFQDLLRLRERLERLEVYTGLRPSAADAGRMDGRGLPGGKLTRRLPGFGGGAGEGAPGASRTRLTGDVAAGVAYVPGAEGAKSHAARAALEQAGMRSGLSVKFTFETACRADGGDVLVTEATAGLGEESSSFMLGGPLNLQKVLYSAEVASGVSLTLAPLGAVGSDVGDSLNPMEDLGVTRFSSGGIPLHRRTKGTAAGVTYRNSLVSLTAAQFLSGWGLTAEPEGDGPGLCASTLGQVTLQPHDDVLLSFAAANRVWPAPPLPSSPGLHWSELGPLVVPRLLPFGRRPSSKGSAGGGDSISGVSGSLGTGVGGEIVGQELWLPPAQDSATTLQSVAVAGAVKLGPNTALSGWAQAENADWLDEEERRRMQWSVSLVHKPGGNGGTDDAPSGPMSSAVSAAAAAGTKKTSNMFRRSVYGVCIGNSHPDVFSSVSGGANGNEAGAPGAAPPSSAGQVQAEVFASVPLGRGLTLQPALLVASNAVSGTHTSFMLRSKWLL